MAPLSFYNKQAEAPSGSLAVPETIRSCIVAYEAVGVQKVRLLDGAKPETIRRFANEFIA